MTNHEMVITGGVYERQAENVGRGKIARRLVEIEPCRKFRSQLFLRIQSLNFYKFCPNHENM